MCANDLWAFNGRGVINILSIALLRVGFGCSLRDSLSFPLAMALGPCTRAHPSGALLLAHGVMSLVGRYSHEYSDRQSAARPSQVCGQLIEHTRTVSHVSDHPERSRKPNLKYFNNAFVNITLAHFMPSVIERFTIAHALKQLL